MAVSATEALAAFFLVLSRSRVRGKEGIRPLGFLAAREGVLGSRQTLKVLVGSIVFYVEGEALQHL